MKLRGTESKSEGHVTVLKRPAELYHLKPALFQSYPKIVRLILGWMVMILFTLAFLQPALLLILPFPFMWRGKMFYLTSSYLGMSVISLLTPEREVQWIRQVGQLLYEIIDLRTNLNKDDFEYILAYGEKHRLCTCMHPHGIVPYQALVWPAYCDQYMGNLYGFGATADVVFKIPFLRNLLSALSAGSARYKTLLAGLEDGISKPVNAAGRKPKHMFILPGGVAEVFFSKRNEKQEKIVFQSRKNLCKLAIQTNTELVPCYVFGGNDFLDNFATGDSIIAKLSRRVKAGITFFTGQFGLPFLPYAPKCTLVLSEPLHVPSAVDAKDKPRDMDERVAELHSNYCEAINHLFDRYKGLAGYPDHTLEIV